MIIALGTILILVTGWLTASATLLFLEVVAAHFEPADPGHRGAAVQRRSIKVAVLIPAHDEEEHLPGTLASVTPQLRPTDRLLVIADNCTRGGTAEIARDAGAEVMERHDPVNRGKGFALMAGFDRLMNDPAGKRPDVIIINDADTIVSADAITYLAAQCVRLDRPVQGLYLMEPGGDAEPSGKLSRLALLLKNYVRPLGALRLGFPCPFFGSGIALPAGAIEHAKCDGADLVEDMRLGLNLSAHGYGPVFCPEARFTGILDDDDAADGVQRRRWEHGHLSVASGMPWLFVKSLLVGDWRRALSALDHGILPIMSLTLVLMSITAAAAVAAFFLASITFWILAGVAALGVLAVVASLFLARDLLVRRMSVPAAPQAVFGYMAGRLASQSSWLVKRQKGWVRTPRNEAERAAAMKPPMPKADAPKPDRTPAGSL